MSSRRRRGAAWLAFVSTTVLGFGFPAAGLQHEEIGRLLAGDQWPQALESARLFVREHPGDPEGIALLGRALFRAGLLSDAEEVLEPLVVAGSAPAQALITLARLRAAEGRGVEAIGLAEQALRLSPEDREVLYWSADLSADRAEAARRLERYLELSKGEADDPDRIDVARGALKLYRALDDRPVWVQATRPPRAEIPLELIWDEQGRRLGYTVQAEIGPKGRKVRLLLDTGSTGLFVVERKAKKCGFQPLSEETAFGGGGKRRHATRRGLFSVFTVGELRFRDALVGTSRRELEPHGRYHGLLGLSVFDGYRVTLDLAAETLLLEPAEESFDGDFYWSVAGQMLVQASLSGGGGGLFLFDTGAHWSIVSNRMARVEGARLIPVEDVRGFGGQVEGASLLRGVDVRFQGLTSGSGNLRATDLSVRSRVGGVEISGFLGMDLLDGSRIVIDTVARRLRVAKAL